MEDDHKTDCDRSGIDLIVGWLTLNVFLSANFDEENNDPC